MTEQNTEEFEGFDDIWSAILDERVLIKLADKIEALRMKIVEDQKPKLKAADDSKSDVSFTDSSALRKDADEPESPSNFKLIDNTIRSEVQKSLYKQFMNESKVENQGLKFDLMRAQEPSEESEDEQDQDQEDQKEDASMPQTDAPSLLKTNDLDQPRTYENSNRGPEIPSIPELTNEDDKLEQAQELSEARQELKEKSQVSQSQVSKEDPELHKDASKSYTTESTLVNKLGVGANIEKNNEEFKQLNEMAGQQQQEAATSRSP